MAISLRKLGRDFSAPPVQVTVNKDGRDVKVQTYEMEKFAANYLNDPFRYFLHIITFGFLRNTGENGSLSKEALTESAREVRAVNDDIQREIGKVLADIAKNPELQIPREIKFDIPYSGKNYTSRTVVLSEVDGSLHMCFNDELTNKLFFEEYVVPGLTFETLHKKLVNRADDILPDVYEEEIDTDSEINADSFEDVLVGCTRNGVV